MCLIVDVNVAREVFSDTEEPDFAEIRKALFQLKAPLVRIVYGGLLREELLRVEEVRRALVVLDRAGRTRQISDAEVAGETSAVQALALCISNDAHIIALARVAGVRLLCSRDQALHADFTNKDLIDTPRGKVYQNASHKHLIRQFCR